MGEVLDGKRCDDHRETDCTTAHVPSFLLSKSTMVR